MSEYITKGQAFDVFIEAHTNFQKNKDSGESLGNFVAKGLINAAPADVGPVVRANNIADAHPSDEFMCGRCGLTLGGYYEVVVDEDADGDVTHFEYTAWNYCPRCGARMEDE